MNYHVKASVTFYPTDQGGRKQPVWSGYRPQIFYKDRDWCGILTFVTKEVVFPGDTVITWITFLTPENHQGITKLMPFLVREGPFEIGKGTVLEVLPDLFIPVQTPPKTL